MAAVFFSVALVALSSPAWITAGSLPTKTISVTITQASEDDFLCDQGEFRITEETKITSENGEEIATLGLVDLPCRATVTYEISNMKMKDAVEVKVVSSQKKKRSDLPE